jgi:hypothetical protein
MKKYILGLVIASFLLAPVAFTMPGLIVASDAYAGEAPDKVIPDTDVIATIGNIADWLFYILIGVSVLFIVIAGLEYVTARGDPEKIKSAGQKVLYALIGIIVASLAKGLVVLVQYFPSAS